MIEIDLLDMLGRELNDPEVRNVFGALEEEPNVERDETGAHYFFSSSGLSFFFREGECLDSVFRVAEESAIRRHGESNKGGPLQNKRYEVNQEAYEAAGGTVSKPTQ